MREPVKLDNSIPNLLDYAPQALEAFFSALGEKSFRAQQLLKWVHQLGVVDFTQMTNFSLVLRRYLSANTILSFPIISDCKISRDGTYKWVMQLADKKCIETVFIPEEGRGTLCISSQVGCSLNCGFCATATLGFGRNLRVNEIIGQLWVAIRELSSTKFARDRVITNVVMMGMGEPLLNFVNVVKAMDLMLDDNAYGLSKYRVTLSTCGVVPYIWKLREVSPVSLAVSLHAPNNELRDKLIPINKKYPLEELMKVCKEYFKGSKRAITFEYVMLQGINDKPEHAEQLVKLLRNITCKVNLIPFNEYVNSCYRCSTKEALEAFRNILLSAGINTVTRKTRGSDIKASCGQLVGDY